MMWATQNRLRGWSRQNWLPLEVSRARSPYPPTAQSRQEDTETPRFKAVPPRPCLLKEGTGLGDWVVQLDAFSDLTVDARFWGSGHLSHSAERLFPQLLLFPWVLTSCVSLPGPCSPS